MSKPIINEQWEFLNVLVNDEDESGSELQIEDEGDEVEVIDMMDIENMPIYTLSPNGTVQPLMRHCLPDSPERRIELQETTSEGRERSPLHSPTPPPYSPISPKRQEDNEAERLVVKFTDHEEVTVSQEIQPTRSEAVRVRGQFRTRGTRLRGRNRDRGRGHNTKAVIGESGWRRGERVIEVCLNDEDVPPSLRKMVLDLEASRHARNAHDMRKRRVVEANKEDSDSETEYFDADSSIVRELFDEDHEALKFQWSPMATFSGRPEEFQPKSKPGPSCNTTCAYEAFRQYWDDDIMEHIVRETNRYAAELKSSSVRFARDWYETNVHEIMILFAFWMMLGVIRMPSITSCFSNNSLLKTAVFRTLLTEQRYWLLTRALHFVNNAERTPDSSKLFSLGPIVDHLNKKFKEAYTLSQNIVIDESLTLWKGELSFKQYIKTKAARFGIKTYELCESATGYLWSFIIYTGKNQEASSSRMPKSTEIVVQLIKPLLNQGYRLFLDNWFNSPVLARFLKRNKTDCVGTLRKYRKHVPALIQLATVPEGTCIARHSGDVVVMVYQDKKPVYTISTCHGTESVHCNSTRRKSSHYKPAVIADYNLSMGGVDKKDQILQPYLIERKKNRKWYMKMFKRLLNISIFNSRILVDKSTTDQVKQQAFRLVLVKGMLERHLTQANPTLPKPMALRLCSNRCADLPESRFVGAGVHFIIRSPVPDNENRTLGSSRYSKNRRCCMWCSVREKKVSRTVYLCNRCEVPLCLEGCFQKFHTVR